MSEEKFQVGQTVTPIESRWRGHDVITAGVPYVVKAIDAGGNLILQSDPPHLRIGWNVANFKLFAAAPPTPNHAELVDWIAPLAEQLVASLTSMGGRLKTYEDNVEWTAAMISSRAPDCSPATELAEAAKDANEVIYLVAAYLADDNRRAYAMKLRDAADTLSAALAKVEGE